MLLMSYLFLDINDYLLLLSEFFLILKIQLVNATLQTK